jgi:hypothetical protein
MATTVGELIEYLNQVEDKNQAVIYQYYLAEHFSVDKKTFAKVADDFDSMMPSDSDNHDAVAEALADARSCCDHEYESACSCCTGECDTCSPEE